MDPDPTLRATFWTVALGEGLAILDSLGVAPWSVQRYLALPSLSAAKRAAWLLALGSVVTRCLCYATGIAMFAYYFDCDPVASKVVQHRDNLVPHFLMDVVGGWAGLPGIFIAGVFSAALSTVSSTLNTLAGVLYADFVAGWLPAGHRAALALKLITLAMGASIVGMTAVIERLGSIFEVAMSLTGFTTGAVFGLFLLGLLVPWAEAVGAAAGAAASAATMAVVCLGALHAKSAGALRYPELPTRIDGCSASDYRQILSANLTAWPPRGPAVESEPWLWPAFRLSPFLYPAAGPLLTVAVGAAVSAAVRALRPCRGLLPATADPDLLAPPVARLVRAQRSRATGAHRRGSKAQVGVDAEMADYQAVPTEIATAGQQRPDCQTL